MADDDLTIIDLYDRLNANVFEDDGPTLTDEGAASLLANYQGLVAEYGESLVKTKMNELNSLTHAAIRAHEHKR